MKSSVIILVFFVIAIFTLSCSCAKISSQETSRKSSPIVNEQKHEISKPDTQESKQSFLPSSQSGNISAGENSLTVKDSQGSPPYISTQLYDTSDSKNNWAATITRVYHVTSYSLGFVAVLVAFWYVGTSLLTIFSMLGGMFLKKAGDSKRSYTKPLLRTRRSIQTNEQMTQLASMVLSAIEQAECLEKSICLVGSEVVESSRGKVALNLIGKLVPPSVHNNIYYITLKKSLETPAYCDTLKCKYEPAYQKMRLLTNFLRR